MIYTLLVKRLDTYGWKWSYTCDSEVLSGMLASGWKVLLQGSRQEIVLDCIDRNFNYQKKLRDSKTAVR